MAQIRPALYIDKAHLAYCENIHRHLCPRQILGIRMGILVQRLFQVELPQTDKRLFAIVETDGCFVTGITASTGCRIERRTMRVVDYGKVAVTFVDTSENRAWRIYPHHAARQRASDLLPSSKSRWHAQFEAYQTMDDDDLLKWQTVVLKDDLQTHISPHSKRVVCTNCGEDVINARYMNIDGKIVCRPCANGAYYRMSCYQDK